MKEVRDGVVAGTSLGTWDITMTPIAGYDYGAVAGRNPIPFIVPASPSPSSAVDGGHWAGGEEAEDTDRPDLPSTVIPPQSRGILQSRLNGDKTQTSGTSTFERDLRIPLVGPNGGLVPNRARSFGGTCACWV